MLLGEPGAGKTELLFHTAARLAELAMTDPTMPIPLFVSARDLVAGKDLAGALRRQGLAGEDLLVQLTSLATTRFYLLIDGLDEAHQSSLLTRITQERARFASRIAAVILTSRPSFTPTLPRCRSAMLCPWSGDERAEFVDRWSHYDTSSAEQVRPHLSDPELFEMFANPLTATLSLFTVRRCPEALRSRSLLYASVYGRVLQKWPEVRSHDSAAGPSPWEAVADVLRELATECLRERRASIPRWRLEAMLQARDRDLWSRRLDEIEVALGILAPYNDDRELVFHDRRLMEYLAAEKLRARPDQLLARASEPWAHEPVRLALGLLANEEQDLAKAILCGLVLQQRTDTPGLNDRALRSVLIACDVAADEPELDAFVAPELADALFRRIVEEYSNWVGDRVASQARRIARRGGPTFELLRPRLVELLTDEALRKPFSPAAISEMFTSREHALMGLLHRSELVRRAACEHLERYVDDPEVQIRLQSMLFDRGTSWDSEIPFVAGAVLRRARRDHSFSTTLSDLRMLLGFKAQMPSGGAAIALLPDEAPPDELAAALAAALRASRAIPQEVFEALERVPGGQAAVQTHLAGWRERLSRDDPPDTPSQPLTKFPYTGYVRSRAFEVLAACAGQSGAFLDDVLAVEDNLHAYTESLELLSESELYRLLDRVRSVDYSLCSVAQEKLGQRALREPRLSRYVLDWWDAIAGGSTHARHFFPGRALEPLVLAGARDAVAAYARWLPHGRPSFGGDPAHFEAMIPREVFAVLEVREAVYRILDPDHAPVRLLQLRRLARAWEHDQAQWDRVESLLAQEHQRWLDADADRVKYWNCRQLFAHLRGVEIPCNVRHTFARIFDGVATSERHHERGPDSNEWHRFVMMAIEFAAASGLARDIETNLRTLAGTDAPPGCRYVGLHAACCLNELLNDDEARRLSAMWSEHFADTAEFERIDRSRLAAFVARSPDSWASSLQARLGEQNVTFYCPLELLGVFSALPVAHQRSTAEALLRLTTISSIPWVNRHWMERRLVRLADEIHRIAFETGLR